MSAISTNVEAGLAKYANVSQTLVLQVYTLAQAERPVYSSGQSVEVVVELFNPDVRTRL